jgi:N6-adenosine-specific RNA methylase IME4
MDIKDICNLPIKSIADKDCVLFLWVTYPMLKEAMDLIDSWGFKYKTCAFSWVKTNKKSNTPFVGMGYYTRANNEICILATKGKPLQRQSKAVRQVILSPIREHSRKPDEVRDRIIDLFGDLPRIELFCRHPEQGWDSMGDELNG